MKSDKLFDDGAVKTLKDEEKRPSIWLFRLLLLGFGLTLCLVIGLGWYTVQRIVSPANNRQTPTVPGSTVVSADEWRFPFPMQFAGPDDAITLGETVIATSEFSFSIWFKTGADLYAQTILGNYRPCSYSKNGFILVYYGTTTTEGARLELVNGGGTNFVQRFGVLSDDQWHHAVGVFYAQQMTLFLDGEQVGTLAESYTPTTIDLQIGSADEAQANCAYGNSNYFQGEMADLRLYQHPLTEVEVVTLFQDKP